MLKGARVIVMLALGAGGARGLGAQELARLCQSAAQVTVGQWASYSASGGQDDGAQVRLAVVGSERHGDSTLYWLEIKHSAPNAAHNAVWQALVPGFGAELVGIRALVWQQGDQAAMRLPDQMVSMFGQQAGQANPALGIVLHCASARVIGWESVIMPSGPVRALHVADAEGNEAWRVQDVPFGFVKVRMKNGAMMTLISQGADAKSSLVGMP